jgi:hypothetical protein
MDESNPQRELIGLEVEIAPFDDYLSQEGSRIKLLPGSVHFASPLGRGAVAPQVGGYLVRRCPDGGEYLIRATARVGAGTAERWAHLFEATAPRADASGACSRKTTPSDKS